MIVVFLAIAPPVAHHQFNATCPPFREIAEGEHNVERRTQAGDVPYFVRADFGATIAADPAALRLVEAAADSLHRTSLRGECDRQRRVWQHRVDSARRRPKGSERDAALAEAQRQTTTACEQLQARYGEMRPMAEAFKSKEQRAAERGGQAAAWGLYPFEGPPPRPLGTQKKGETAAAAPPQRGEAEPTEGVLGAASDSAQPDVLGASLPGWPVDELPSATPVGA